MTYALENLQPSPPPVVGIPPGFTAAASRVLEHLHSIGGGTWLAVRVDGEVATVVAAAGHEWTISSPDLDLPPSVESLVAAGRGSDSAVIIAGPDRAIAVPVQVSDVVVGVLCGLGVDEVALHADQVAGLELQTDLLAGILEHELVADSARRQVEHLETQALRDGLTGLLNRAGWNQVIERETERCRRYGSAAAILVVDLDDLKVVNDRFGHARGDELLLALAEAMTEISRASDAVARLGGDEFALLALETGDEVAEQIAARLRVELETRGIAASIGAVDSGPRADLVEAWRLADLAMYTDKRARRQD